ncbi:UNVERIFIED_CONTAM: hypothetical protein PYX00_009096 [Menopon gallinae]
MGKIIQRDFFPDLEKLKAQNEYLDALSQNDSEKIREIYAKYSSGKRPPTERFPSPATFETPQNVRPNDPIEDISSQDNGKGKERLEKSQSNENESGKSIKGLSLDQYLNSHTSEDNESFKEIQKESVKRHKLKYAWLYKDEDAINSDFEKTLKVPSIEQQAEGQEKLLAIDTWTYKNQNHCMFVPDGMKPSEEEEAELLQKQREIVHANTSFKQVPFDERQNKDTIHELALNQAKSQEGKIGVDGKIVTCNETPKVNGFSFVRTPSPSPGVNESPLLTWGEIEGTPFRLDGGDTPYIATPGPKFRIPEIPKREKIAMALADKASESYRDRKRRAIEAARSQLSGQTPKRQSSIDRLNDMSPAAQRLASASLGRRLGTDLLLRESYTPSPRSNRTRTPFLTPSPKTPSTPRTPSGLSSPNVKLKNLIRRPTPVSVTDDLLKLPRIGANRPKASDFF